MFELPRGITGFGVDHPASEIEARRQGFLRWIRTVASDLDSPVVDLAPGELRSSFDAVWLERSDRWVLHNRYVPIVGVLDQAPEPGLSWAVAGEWSDLDIPEHVQGWGPQVLNAATLNAPLETSLDHLGLGSKEQADRYKPQTVGHVIFNYWT